MQSIEVARVPLCVDMDGTFLKTNTLPELMLALIHHRPLSVFFLLVWLLRGKAYLQRQVAKRVQLDATILPYDQEVLAWLQQQRGNGRTILLVTGVERATAKPVADFLQLFDGIISTVEQPNRSGTKEAALTKLFGAGGFDYVGGSSPSLNVFRHSRSHWSAAVRALRLHQWLKNLLVCVPLFASHQIMNGPLVLRSLLVWLAFSFCASGIYVLNDLMDVPADRQHRTKRHRPLASGELQAGWGIAIAAMLIVAGGTIAALLSAATPIVLGVYCAVSIAYSMYLKRKLLVDVFTLSLLYTSRIWAGHTATGVPYSPWLLSFSLFIFLSLALSKRVSELRALALNGVQRTAGRGYRTDDAVQLTIFGVSSGFVASLVLSLYINSLSVTLLYRRPMLLWILCPIVLYWICRIWMLAHRGQMNEDPIWFAIRDRVTYAIGIASALVLLLATKDWLPAIPTSL